MIARIHNGLMWMSVAVLSLSLSNSTLFAVAAGSLTLAWDPSSDPTVVGYRLYQGLQPQDFTNVVDVSSNLQVTVSNLVPGVTYFFAVTAYDSTGLESAFSGVISYTIPTSAPRPDPLLTLSIFENDSNQAVLTGTGTAGSVYDVYAALDLSTWMVIGTVTVDPTGHFGFTDQLSYAIPWRFYRLRPHSP